MNALLNYPGAKWAMAAEIVSLTPPNCLMWGNGIALPTALYVMQGIAEALEVDNAVAV